MHQESVQWYLVLLRKFHFCRIGTLNGQGLVYEIAVTGLYHRPFLYLSRHIDRGALHGQTFDLILIVVWFYYDVSRISIADHGSVGIIILSLCPFCHLPACVWRIFRIAARKFIKRFAVYNF